MNMKIVSLTKLFAVVNLLDDQNTGFPGSLVTDQ
jgi:hypothetical protein